MKSLEDDFTDGLVIKNLVEILSGSKIDMPFGEYAQSEERQRRNLASILNQTENIIQINEELKR